MNSKISLTLVACGALAFGLAAHAENRVSIDLGLRLGPPPPIVVHRAPPRPVVEHMSVSPGPDYVWVAGHHAWRGNDWVWVQGSWERPPQRGAVWVESRWDDRNQNWVDGYWNVERRDDRDFRDQAERERRDRERENRDRMERERRDREERDRHEREMRDRADRDRMEHNDHHDNVVVVEAPPPPRHEVRMERPAPDYVWVDGYWAWRGRHHEWVPGRWERPPHSHATWIAPRWEHRNGSYVFIEGTWH